MGILMPLLFCLAQHTALHVVADQLREGETCSLSWTICMSSVTQIELVRFTPSFNGCCFVPPTSASIGGEPRFGTEVAMSPRRVHDCKQLLSSQGVKILGSPVGHLGNVSAQLQLKSDSHLVLFDRIPALEDIQAAWLLLLFCAQAKANFLLAVCPPRVNAPVRNAT